MLPLLNQRFLLYGSQNPSVERNYYFFFLFSVENRGNTHCACLVLSSSSNSGLPFPYWDWGCYLQRLSMLATGLVLGQSTFVPVHTELNLLHWVIITTVQKRHCSPKPPVPFYYRHSESCCCVGRGLLFRKPHWNPGTWFTKSINVHRSVSSHWTGSSSPFFLTCLILI